MRMRTPIYPFMLGAAFALGLSGAVPSANAEPARFFQVEDNPQADVCGSVVNPQEIGCWEESFYPGGPTPFGSELREAWLKACLTEPENTNQTSPGIEPDMSTKAAICDTSTNECRDSEVPNPATGPGEIAVLCPFPAVSNVLTKDGRLVHWTGIDGIESQLQAVGFVTQSEQIDSPWRILDLAGGPPGTLTSPVQKDPITGSIDEQDDTGGGGDRFCANQTVLASGKIMVSGGTRWESAEGIELLGTETTTIYDPDTDENVLAGSMFDGRWYESMSMMPNGKVLAGAGISTLRLPNTHNSTWEVFNPADSQWTKFDGTDQALDTASTGSLQAYLANGSPLLLLPLYSRLVLLPNGEVAYTGNGQLWGPFGEHYIEAIWNNTFFVDPKNGGQRWRALTTATGTADTTIVRNGGQSMLMALKPPFNSARIAVVGGNEYRDSVPTPFVEVMEVDVSGDAPVVARMIETHLMNQARWFHTGVTLPDRSIFMVGGGTCDEVVSPGCELAIFETERAITPDVGTVGPWQQTAESQRPRTYHNTAGVVLPDGRVVSMGHRPIPVGYADSPDDLAELHAFHFGSTAQIGRDLMVEVYSPPYLFNPAGNARVSGVDRPRIKKTGTKDTVAYAESFCLKVDGVESIDNVEAQILRNIAVTHVEQHEQRLVVLEKTGICAGGSGIQVSGPPNGDVAPPGFYMLSVVESGRSDANAQTPWVPSEAKVVQVCVDDTFWASCAGT